MTDDIDQVHDADALEATNSIVGEPATTQAGVREVAPRRRFSGLRRTGLGIGAIGVKELRGRMRGRRAFVILSLYLILLGGFTWMVELIMERTYSAGFGGSSAFATGPSGRASSPHC